MSGFNPAKPSIANVKITDLVRLNNSVNGNPRWRVTLDTGAVLVTQSDAACSYGIGNPELRGQVDIWVSRNGRITHVYPAKGA